MKILNINPLSLKNGQDRYGTTFQNSRQATIARGPNKYEVVQVLQSKFDRLNGVQIYEVKYKNGDIEWIPEDQLEAIKNSTDLICPNCGDNLGKDRENSDPAYCGNCGKSFKNPAGDKFENGGVGVFDFKIKGHEIWVSVKDYDEDKKFPPYQVTVNYPDGEQSIYYWTTPPKRNLSQADVVSFLRTKGVSL